MIVEGIMALAILYTVIGEPVRSALTAAGLMELTADLPTTHEVVDPQGRKIKFFTTDFVDDKGKIHTNFLIGKVKNDAGKEVVVVLTESEVEMMKTAAFLEAAVDKGIPIGPDVGKRIAALVKKRTQEISRAKSRRAEVKERRMSPGAKRAKERLQRAAR